VNIHLKGSPVLEVRDELDHLMRERASALTIFSRHPLIEAVIPKNSGLRSHSSIVIFFHGMIDQIVDMIIPWGF
jgi:hypothetical protein